ncbi:MAG: hypothetical protein FWD31_11740 [Planctomycetaceae bacterium]|nr:hypothetical protein [Planctomycetaceae bacterium]
MLTLCWNLWNLLIGKMLRSTEVDLYPDAEVLLRERRILDKMSVSTTSNVIGAAMPAMTGYS